MYTAKDKDLNSYYQRWLNSTENTIYKAYGRPSVYKVRAFERCEDIMHEFDGYSLRVVGHNSSQFSAAFTTDTDFYVITKDNIYRMALSEVK
jgi:hypothetical protein